MKQWVVPEIVAKFTQEELFVGDVLADHNNWNQSHNQVYNRTYSQSC